MRDRTKGSKDQREVVKYHHAGSNHMIVSGKSMRDNDRKMMMTVLFGHGLIGC